MLRRRLLVVLPVIDLEAIGERVKTAAIAALEDSARIVEGRAKARAPVGHGDRGHKAGTERRVRFKTRAEVVADREVRRRLGLGREYVAAPRTRLRSRRGMTKAKIVVASPPSRLREEGPGGRLRDEITTTGVVQAGSRFSVMVVSPTPYAKFQEFGTRHNPAHPYLRPALRESRGEVVSAVRTAVRRSIKGTVEIRVTE